MNTSRRRGVAAAVAAITLLLAGCAPAPPPASARDSVALGPPPYDVWARVLQRYVDAQGRVDFAGLAADPADLDRYVAYVARISPASAPALFPDRQAVLAYHLNTYNALAMKRVIDSGIPQTLSGLRKLQFFYFSRQWVGGTALSLYAYENEVIRPLGDARVHFALNCMAVSCPRLPREPFLPETLDAQLDRAARAFVAEERNVRTDQATHVLQLSQILDFYTVDFLAHASSLAAYINRYRSAAVPEDFEIRFIPYDWTVNRQPPRAGARP